jgi:hypothetical protein
MKKTFGVTTRGVGDMCDQQAVRGVASSKGIGGCDFEISR